MVAWGLEQEWGLAANREEESFGDVGNILKLFTRLYTFTEISESQQVNLMIHKVYLNKAKSNAKATNQLKWGFKTLWLRFLHIILAKRASQYHKSYYSWKLEILKTKSYHFNVKLFFSAFF